jgi:hypothetical protein
VSLTDSNIPMFVIFYNRYTVLDTTDGSSTPTVPTVITSENGAAPTSAIQTVITSENGTVPTASITAASVSEHQTKSHHKAAIIVGSVIGSSVCLAVLAGLAFLAFRRKKEVTYFIFLLPLCCRPPG